MRCMRRCRYVTTPSGGRADHRHALAAKMAAGICRHAAVFDRFRPSVVDRKKTGHGKGKVNAPGGKWELGETLLDCARREMREETGIEAEPPGCAAELRFVERSGPQWLGYVFVARDFSGNMAETPEARPFWCPLNGIPYERMWADDAIWLPRVLRHQLLTGHGASSPLVYDLLFEAGAARASIESAVGVEPIRTHTKA